MKNSPLTFVLPVALATASFLVGAPAAKACTVSCSGDHVRWAEHHNPGDARCAITTEDGKVTMLLTDRVIALQLSDRTLHRVRHELRDKESDQEDNPLGYAIAAAVIGTVRALIDDSFEVRLRDLRDVSYDNHRLVLTARNGDSVFQDSNICDTDVLTAFSDQDAQRFVREYRKLKGRGD